MCRLPTVIPRTTKVKREGALPVTEPGSSAHRPHWWESCSTCFSLPALNSRPRGTFLPHEEVRPLRTGFKTFHIVLIFILCLSLEQSYFSSLGEKVSKPPGNLACIREAERWAWCEGTKHMLQPSLRTEAVMRLNPQLKRWALKADVGAHCKFKMRTPML